MKKYLIYKPEIDGLRGLAIISVILYHADITINGYSLFKGGYVGVDIFFVISGFLITRLISQELYLTNNFSFTLFFKRRIRRIFPLLLFVVLSCLIFSYFFIIPEKFFDIPYNIFSIIFYFSNIYFEITNNTYAIKDGLENPFIHTWSLSLEEQFYIVFPIIYYVSIKFFRNYFLLIMFIISTISLLLAHYGSINFSSLNFYYLPSRMWEFIAGSMLAYIEVFYKIKKNPITLKIYPLAGLLLIFYALITFDENTLHPSLKTLIPVLGVCLIIWCSEKNGIIIKLFSNKLIVFVGLISFSLYLWHYPILIYAKLFATLTINIKIFLIFLSFVISTFSYYLIEKPFRNNKYRFKKIFILIIFLYLIIIAICISSIKTDGFKYRLPKFLADSFSILKTREILKDENEKECYGNFSKGCSFYKEKKQKIFLIGDSHAASISFDLKEKLALKNYQFLTFTDGLCYYFPGFNLMYDKKVYGECSDKNITNVEKKILGSQKSIIILFGRLPVILNKTWFDNKEGGVEGGNIHLHHETKSSQITLQETFIKGAQKLINDGHKLILIYPFPEVGFHTRSELFNRGGKNIINFKKFFENKDNYLTTSYDVFKERSLSSYKMLDKVKHYNVHRIYLDSIVCNTIIKSRCVTHDEKNVYYEDDDHPSIYAADIISDLIVQKLNEINK